MAAMRGAPPGRSSIALCLRCALTKSSPFALSFRWRGIGHIALAEHRLFVRRRRQLPGASRWRPYLGVDVYVENKGLVRLNRVLECALKILRPGHGYGVDTGCTRPRSKVGIVRFVIGSFLEHRTVLPATEHSELDVANGNPSEVIPDQPDDGDVVLHRRAQYVRHHREAAIAGNRNDWPVGCRQLGPERASCAESHAGKAPGVEHGLRTARLPELHVPIVIDADIAAQNSV